MFNFAYRTLLVMFFVLKFYFWNVYIFSNMSSENARALQSREKYYFSKQSVTSNVLQT